MPSIRQWGTVPLLISLVLLSVCVEARYDHLLASRATNVQERHVPSHVVQSLSKPTYHPKLGVPTYIRASGIVPTSGKSKFKKQEDGRYSPLQYLSEVASAYNLDPNTLSGARVQSIDTANKLHVAKVKQFLLNTEVFGAQLNIITDEQQRLVALAGHLSPHMRSLTELTAVEQVAFLKKGHPAHVVVHNVLQILTGQVPKGIAPIDEVPTNSWLEVSCTDERVKSLYIKKVLYEGVDSLIPAVAMDVSAKLPLPLNRPSTGKAVKPVSFHALIVVSTIDMKILQVSEQTRKFSEYALYDGWVDEETGFPGTIFGGTDMPVQKATNQMKRQDPTLQQIGFNGWANSWFIENEDRSIGRNVETYGYNETGELVHAWFNWTQIPVQTEGGGTEVVNGVRFDSPYNDDTSKLNTDNVMAAAGQLFYVLNHLHDEWTGRGWDDNTGVAAGPTDKIKAVVDMRYPGDWVVGDEAHLNPTTELHGDGISPVIHFPALVKKLNPFTPENSMIPAFDVCMTTHEFIHIMVERMLDPANVAALTSVQGRGISEGLGDFVCLLNQPSELDAEQVEMNGKTVWQWKVANKNFGWRVGVPDPSTVKTTQRLRRFDYSTDKSINPLTFGDLSPRLQGGDVRTSDWLKERLGNADVVVGFNYDPHQAGEIVATALWECFYQLFRIHGVTEARNRMKTYLFDAIQLSASPTILQLRDQFLTVAKQNSMDDYTALWTGFANRGLGIHAAGPDLSSPAMYGATESFVPGPIENVVYNVTIGKHWEIVSDNCNNDGIIQGLEVAVIKVPITNGGTRPVLVKLLHVKQDFFKPPENKPEIEVIQPGQTTHVMIQLRLKGNFPPYPQAHRASHVNDKWPWKSGSINDLNKNNKAILELGFEAWVPPSRSGEEPTVKVIQPWTETWETRVNFEATLTSRTDEFDTLYDVWTTRTTNDDVNWKRSYYDPLNTDERGVWTLQTSSQPFESELISPSMNVKTTKQDGSGVTMTFTINVRWDLGDLKAYLEFRMAGNWHNIADDCTIVELPGYLTGRHIGFKSKDGHFAAYSCKINTKNIPVDSRADAQPWSAKRLIQQVRFRIRVVNDGNPMNNYGSGIWINSIGVATEPLETGFFPFPGFSAPTANCKPPPEKPALVDFQTLGPVRMVVEDGCDSDGVLDPFEREKAKLTVEIRNVGVVRARPYLHITTDLDHVFPMTYAGTPWLEPGEKYTVNAAMRYKNTCKAYSIQADCNAQVECDWKSSKCIPQVSFPIQVDIIISDEEDEADSTVVFAAHTYHTGNNDHVVENSHEQFFTTGTNGWTGDGWERKTEQWTLATDGAFMEAHTDPGVVGVKRLRSPPITPYLLTKNLFVNFQLWMNLSGDPSEGIVVQLENHNGAFLYPEIFKPNNYSPLPQLTTDVDGLLGQAVISGVDNNEFKFKTLSEEFPPGFFVEGEAVHLNILLVSSGTMRTSTVRIDGIDVQKDSVLADKTVELGPFEGMIVYGDQNLEPDKCPSVPVVSQDLLTTFDYSCNKLEDAQERVKFEAAFKTGIVNFLSHASITTDQVEILGITCGSTKVLWRLIEIFPAFLPTTYPGMSGTVRISAEFLVNEVMSLEPQAMATALDTALTAAMEEEIKTVFTEDGRAFDFRTRSIDQRPCRRCSIVNENDPNGLVYQCEYTVLGQTKYALSKVDYAAEECGIPAPQP